MNFNLRTDAGARHGRTNGGITESDGTLRAIGLSSGGTALCNVGPESLRPGHAIFLFASPGTVRARNGVARARSRGMPRRLNREIINGTTCPLLRFFPRRAERIILGASRSVRSVRFIRGIRVARDTIAKELDNRARCNSDSSIIIHRGRLRPRQNSVNSPREESSLSIRAKRLR